MNLFAKILRMQFLKKCPGFIYFGHGITSEDITIQGYENIHLDLGHLNRIIVFWQKLGFKFISYQELEQIVLYGITPEYPWIHLTFDDGYKNNLTVALPFLESKNIPFTVYISVSNMLNNLPFHNHKLSVLVDHQNSKEHFKFLIKKFLKINFNHTGEKQASKKAIIKAFKYLKPIDKEAFLVELSANSFLRLEESGDYFHFEEVLTADNLIELSKKDIVNIGSHGYNHNILTTLSEEEIVFEIAESKLVLEKIIDKEINSYCYPNGTEKDYNASIMGICQSKGYKTAFTTCSSKWNNTFGAYSLPRIPLSRKPLYKKALKLLWR